MAGTAGWRAQMVVPAVLGEMTMPEVKTLTICAPCLNGPLNGKIVRRPYDMEEFVVILGDVTYAYRLFPRLTPHQDDGYYWIYMGTTVRTS